MTTLRRVALAAACGLCALAAHKSFASDPSGTAVAVAPAADAQGESGTRVLNVMGPIFMGDRIHTGPAGEVQIKFRDDTRMVVGPNSRMTVDAFVFNADNTARQITMRAFRGAFRFITGKSRKQAYSIRTPASTIGIRGTRFDFAIEADGRMSFALFEGEARLCDANHQCRTLRGTCAVVVVPRQGGIAEVPAGPERAARLRRLFPYVVSQARLRPDFRVDTTGCSTTQARLLENDSTPYARPALARPPAATFSFPTPLTSPGNTGAGSPAGGGSGGGSSGGGGSGGSSAGGGSGGGSSVGGGNPGNGGPGNAGPTPNGSSDWGGPGRGRGDVASNGNNNSNANNNGNGNGNNNGNGNSGNNGNANNNGNGSNNGNNGRGPGRN